MTTSRERVLQSLTFQQPDRTPKDLGGNALDHHQRLRLPQAGCDAQLEMQSQRKGDHVVLQGLVNKLSGRTIPITEDDFSLDLEGRPPLRVANFVFQESRTKALAGGRRLTLHLKNTNPGARLDVIYELGDGDFFVRGRLELVPSAPLPLREVDL